MSDDNVTTITVFSPSKGPGCDQCDHKGTETRIHEGREITLPCQHCIWEPRKRTP